AQHHRSLMPWLFGQPLSLWVAVLGAAAAGLVLVGTRHELAPLLFDAVAEFVGAVKKNYAYGKPLDLPRMRWLLSAMVSRIAAICETQAERTLDDVLAANIEKLRARFPEKFDEALAIDRNVKQEAAAMRSELH
ncbi:hypothetical protein OMR07_13685, partial [Methylobacterium organophilum]|nr:hypothetical protein [Methylobacterium organophilum]